jgi:hypothetical protein
MSQYSRRWFCALSGSVRGRISEFRDGYYARSGRRLQQLVQRVFKSLLECDDRLLVASAGQQEIGRAKARPFCFTNAGSYGEAAYGVGTIL